MTAVSHIRDGFDDNWHDQARWYVWNPSGLPTLNETNQRVEITPPVNTAGMHYAFYGSNGTGDLRGATGTVEVVQVLQGATCSTQLVLQQTDGEHRLVLWSDGATLYAQEDQPGTPSDFPLASYDAQAHRWWRIRHDAAADRVHWETSPDGRAWTSHRDAPPPFAIDAVQIAIGAGLLGAEPAPGMAIFDNVNQVPSGVDVPDRRSAAYNVRVQAAQIALNRGQPWHLDNREETDYPFVANFSKGLPHDAAGDVDPAAYQSLLHALNTRDPADFEAIQLGPGGKKLTNPQGGLAFALEGPDTHAVTQPPAPRIDSAQNSSEMGELYWMAIARDVHFNDYGWHPDVQAAIQSLNTEFSDFRGPRENGAVTARTVFRGIYPGETVGPYLSQFLLKGTSDPRLPAGQGRGTTDGLITYGDLKIDQRQVTVQPGVDYLLDFPWWLEVQNGADKRGMDAIDTSGRRFVRTLRDLGERVHIDNVADHYFNACLILLHEVPGDQLNGNGVISRDMEFPFNPGNPYPGYTRQAPFVTLGAPHALSIVWEALIRALRAVWFQKWFVHRRLRPEEFGGRIDSHLTGRRSYPQIDGEILASLQGGGLAAYVGPNGQRFPWSYLLPQAFPEGAPTHPAYGAGHATGSGACATVLKAFFNENAPIENPVVVNAAGTALDPYTGGDAGQMTVGGELNKLAGNVALGRNGAGVHWRSDYSESLLLGEQVAIGLLQEQSLLLNEPEFYQLTKFDGTTIRIQD
ncbi:vanadium-dependent haloperoxidase, partial [Longimicrobium sp.]|uniref:vanadium-dependent haloperoxidase n=1 Tax=Longimicrobium sp. TaxID=2029185 RepID=UPI002E30D133